MHKISATLITLLVTMPAYSAGLGNLFDPKSPTSATGSVKPNQTQPPAASVAQKTPTSPPTVPTNQNNQTSNPATTQNKK